MATFNQPQDSYRAKVTPTFSLCEQKGVSQQSGSPEVMLMCRETEAQPPTPSRRTCCF